MSLSRIETILSGGEVVPQSRIEKILVGEDIEPQSRIEALLKEKLGGGGGGSTEITDGIVVKSRDADGYATEVDFYGTAIYRYQFGSFYANDFGFKKITSINLKNKRLSILGCTKGKASLLMFNFSFAFFSLTFIAYPFLIVLPQ